MKIRSIASSFTKKRLTLYQLRSSSPYKAIWTDSLWRKQEPTSIPVLTSGVTCIIVLTKRSNLHLPFGGDREGAEVTGRSSLAGKLVPSLGEDQDGLPFGKVRMGCPLGRLGWVVFVKSICRHSLSSNHTKHFSGKKSIIVSFRSSRPHLTIWLPTHYPNDTFLSYLQKSITEVS